MRSNGRMIIVNSAVLNRILPEPPAIVRRSFASTASIFERSAVAFRFAA
jgi:hypothetical protein